MTTKYWLQYHKYDELGYLPDDFIIHTSKQCCQKTIGDAIFLIVGGQNLSKVGDKIGIELPVKKNQETTYILWEKFYVKRVDYLLASEEYKITGGTGIVFKPPILLDSPEFEEFRKHYMTNGFINISQAAYLPTLRELSGEVISQAPVKPVPTMEQKAKVKVPQDIYQALESMGNQKAVKRLDVNFVIQHSSKMGLAKLAKWIEANRRDYLKGSVNGFVAAER